MSDESRYCPECVRLQADLEKARAAYALLARGLAAERLTQDDVDKAHAAYAHVLSKGTRAYDKGREQGATDAAVDIATWLETLALEHPQGKLLAELAERVMDAEYMKDEHEAPAHD